MKNVRKSKLLPALLTLTTLLCVGYWHGLTIGSLFSDHSHMPAKTKLVRITTQHRLNSRQPRFSNVNYSTLGSPHGAEQATLKHGITEVNQIQRITDDGQWIKTTINNITQSLKEYDIVNTSLSTVKCNNNLCEASFSHKTDKEHFRLLQHLNTIEAFSKGFILKTDDNQNQIQTIVYFRRSSEQLSYK
ncbi:MAG TPA: hypothetical protein ENJ32_14125 [Crenotrichaceae bacterium]|nr:hypothetical protein [Crenotrichaceae bacterium]